ncbi:MAG TPA: Ser-Thr-rich GPI-anchored membrane family protein, partial [Candidatus Methanoperedens sp.]|nr:Ser-Thr-rich GPI-anchored membrane family protein [Candidatus Methanoperedens sp.]
MERHIGKVGWWLLILLSVIVAPAVLVAPAAAQTVTVLDPNITNNAWTAGSSHTISWTTTDDVGALVDIKLYKGGVVDSNIMPSAPNTGAFVWTIPETLAPGTDYMVEVVSVANPTIFGQSVPFTVTPAVPRVITSPAGGEVWLTGESRAITWHKGSIDGPFVNIKLLRGQQDPTPGDETIIVINHANNGSFSWIIPPNVAPDTTYRVKIQGMLTGAEIPGDFATSDNYFTIVEPIFEVLAPNGGENWVAGTTRTITWAAVGIAGSDVKIELLKGGEVETTIADPTPNDGNYSWSIPAGQPLGGNYTIRVTSLSQPTLFDESDAQFTISSSASIITYPVGGEVWVTGSPEVITWQLDAVPSGTVSLYLVRGQSDPSPGGQSIIILGVPNTGSFSWNIPKSIPSDVNYRVKLEYSVVVGTQEVIKTTYSDNYFTITSPSFQVLTPNGGENWLTGTTQTITWMTTAAAGADVSIALYRGGVPYSVIAPSVPNSGSYSWAIPLAQALGNDYTIRVTSISQPTLFDESDAPFTVATSASIITSPVGGEVWLSGTSQTISWQQ